MTGTSDPPAGGGGKGALLLLGAIGLLLIPVFVGWIMANRDSDGADDDQSGMSDSVTTIAADATSPGSAEDERVNLSLEAAVIEVSSQFNANFAGANSIDGSLSTEWSSRGDGDNAYIVIDLGAPFDLTGVGFRTREMSDGTAITNSYTITVDEGDEVGPFEAGPGLVITDFSARGRVIRFDLLATTGGNTGAVEIEIYGG